MTATDPGVTGRAEPAPVDPDYPIEPVPVEARKSAFSVAMVLLGFTFFTPTMLAGAEVGAAFRWNELLGVLVLGSAVLGAYVAVLGAIGARTGLTTVVMARYALGRFGAKLASLLLGGTQVGWYGVAVAALADLTAQALGWEGQERALMVAGGVLMGLTAYYGYKGMYLLSVVSVPLMFVLAFWVVKRSLDEVGGWAGLAVQEPSETMTVAVAVTAIVGTFASGGTQAPNWTRFARSGAAAFWVALLAFLVGNGLMLFFGAVGAIAFEQADFVLVLYELGLVAWGLVLLVGNLWTTNDNAAYSFGVAGAELFEHRRKKPFIVGGVAVGTLLAVVGIYDELPRYLILLGIFIPPLGGVIIGDWLVRWRRGRMPHPSTDELPAVRFTVLAAYTLGAFAAWITQNVASFGVPPVNGIVVACLAAMAASAVDRVGES